MAFGAAPGVAAGTSTTVVLPESPPTDQATTSLLPLNATTPPALPGSWVAAAASPAWPGRPISQPSSGLAEGGLSEGAGEADAATYLFYVAT